MEITKVIVKSDSGTEYEITANTTKVGGAFCTCPAWRFAKGEGPKTCKHIEFVAANMHGKG